MKSKFFTLFAAMMLLFGAKAMAQTNGDVNGDGKTPVEQYYYYLGTSPDESLITPDNYKEFCQKVSEFPAEQQIVSVDDEYLYVVLPADKDMLALDLNVGIGELNFKYYSSALSKYIPTKNKNVRLTFDDEKVYVIYRSAATALGRYGVNIKEETPVTSIVLDCTEASMQVGGSIDITATVNPQDATWYKVMWSSDNASVATVDNNGKVTALSEGSTTITAEACDNSGITATCVVTVEAAAVEPEPTWHLSGPATEEEVTTQSYIDGLVYNQTSKPSIISLKKGYNVIIIPSSWTTPTFGLVSDFSKRYTPFTANDLGITNPSNKNVLVLWSEVENATCYVKWGTNVVPEPEPEPEPEAAYYWYVGVTDPRILTPGNVGNEVLDQWTEFTAEKESPVSVSKQDPEYNDHIWYIAAPYDWKYTLYNATGAASNEAGYAMSEATIDGVRYKIWKSKQEQWQVVGQLTITNHVPITAITLSHTAITMKEGEQLEVTATVTPENATNRMLSWVSSDESVADYYNGKVYAFAPGTATITVTDTDFYGNKASTSFTVTVEAVAVDPEPEGLSTSKYYRVKNVTTGLYLQVEGNNTNMKLQNKAEGLAMMQIFGLEDAGEEKYYIKAADADSRYYAHASGWDFNATTNADNKTPFTIALVEGETQVYTLHQSVAEFTGLAGTDAAEAGTVIYCNKNVNQNGKWAFEALTAEEQTAYVATLTAAVKPALEAAIAHAEAVVSARSAVLSADEVAAINAAVAAAKAEKDNTADVDVLNALADAINAAVNEAIYVWNLDELSNEVCYAVSTEDRGAWYSQANNLTSTGKLEIAADATDSKQQFAFVKSAATGACYLYSVSEEKFVKVEGSYTALTEAPVQTISILNGTRSAAFPWVVALNAEDGQKQMGISNGYDPAVITFYNDLGDGGNTVRIEKVTTFDPAKAIEAIKALETGIEKTTVNGEQTTVIYDLTGRRVEKATKGIYIVGGRKVVIK